MCHFVMSTNYMRFFFEPLFLRFKQTNKILKSISILNAGMHITTKLTWSCNIDMHELNEKNGRKNSKQISNDKSYMRREIAWAKCVSFIFMAVVVKPNVCINLKKSHCQTKTNCSLLKTIKWYSYTRILYDSHNTRTTLRWTKLNNCVYILLSWTFHWMSLKMANIFWKIFVKNIYHLLQYHHYRMHDQTCDLIT